nr:membrane bound acyltransferase:hhat [Hymenolepis microstoma]
MRELSVSLFIVAISCPLVVLLFALIVPILYSSVGYATRSKTLLWIITLLLFIYYESTVKQILVVLDRGEATILQATLALILLRSTSIGIEHANVLSMPAKPKSIQVNRLSLQNLFLLLSYSLYPPTFLFGPLTLYSDWCCSRQYEVTKSVTVPPGYKGCLVTRILSCKNLVWRGVRLVFWFLFWEFIIHVVYPRALIYSMTKPIMGVPPPPLDSNATTFHGSRFIKSDRSAPGCAVYLLGMQFYFTYLQIYGWPSWFSDLEMLINKGTSSGDGVLCLVPDGPQCFSHMLLFSQIWRTFDRGLYNFLKWYVYLPWLNQAEGPSLCRKVLAGLLVFTFVLIFHTMNEVNSIWVLINILQVFFEQLIRWAYKSTQFGDSVRARFSPDNIQRLTGILCSVSGMISSAGFFFFSLGYSSGIWIFYLMFFDPIYLPVSLVLFYCTYQLSTEMESLPNNKMKNKVC